MKDLQPIRAIAEQLLVLSAELLRQLSEEGRERSAVVETTKKTPTEIYYSFRA